MTSKAQTVKEYLSSLPEDRRQSIEAVRKVILQNLNKGFEEGMQYGMIGYYVPHRIYPAGYHCDPKQPLPFACLASQKNHLALYLICVYASPDHDQWFRQEWAKSGKKLDMGKSCIRFKKADDLPLDLIGEVIARVPLQEHIAFYENVVKGIGKKKASATARSKPAKASGARSAAAKSSSARSRRTAR